MLVFSGTYMLEREGDPGVSPAFACSWQVKIIDFSMAGKSVQAHIRPFALFASRKEGGIFKASCAESLGKRICKDFDLNVDDILWVEAFPDHPDELFAAVFTPRYKADAVSYTISWRPLLENEYKAIASWVD
jgi:hypothetical protein